MTSRTLTRAELAEANRTLERLRPTVEAARRDPKNRGRILPDQARGLPVLSADMSDRKRRVRVVCEMYGAPTALVDEMNRRCLSVRAAYGLLQAATGTANVITKAGVDSVWISLVAMDHNTQPKETKQ